MLDPSAAGWALLALGVGGGALVQAATGFGFAIIAAPVFLGVLDSIAAVPILIALHVIQCFIVVPPAWPATPRRELACLMIGGAAGAPLGFWLLGSLDVRTLKLAAGSVILVAAALIAARRLLAVAGSPATTACKGGPAPAIAAGAVAGALTAVLVMPGPPLMVHLMRRPLPPEAARSLAMTFFAACYVAVLAMSLASGVLGGDEWRLIALLAPAVVVGTLLGQHLARTLADRYFMPVLNALLALAGIGAILSAL